MFKINGVEVTAPKKLKVTISDIDGKSKRNTKAQMLRDRIAVKRKLECEWPPLTSSQISQILNAVSDVFFSVTYIDPKDGEVTKTCYVGDRPSALMYEFANSEYLWSGLSFSIIEQ